MGRVHLGSLQGQTGVVQLAIAALAPIPEAGRRVRVSPPVEVRRIPRIADLLAPNQVVRVPVLPQRGDTRSADDGA